MVRNGGIYCFFGDFNAVRNESERLGSVMCRVSAADFNNFIDELELVDVPMTGKKIYSR